MAADALAPLAESVYRGIITCLLGGDGAYSFASTGFGFSDRTSEGFSSGLSSSSENGISSSSFGTFLNFCFRSMLGDEEPLIDYC